MNVQDDTETREAEVAQLPAESGLKPENVRQMKIAMATLVACAVRATNDNELEQRFVSLVDQAFDNYRTNSDADPQHVLEALHWTREMLSGWNPVPGRKTPIFGSGTEA
ncbi:hypothetical protein G7077_03270 [Sphingomonas piscis]|uniref:Uncharacterized protein n=1 Tax=Sphingomonas piscis TaxID=2714943 RepID=A0A6G7YMW3_9SPHN|nr:hypothetical protein [Sphingomonas piscis]QIK78078.1 hypothetical protein G7077_03270 [Sphingomonas piscis]